MQATKILGWQIWLSRVLILAVLVLNLQAALWLILSPDRFVASFELSGVAGRVAVQGVGILFLMWQVPYVLATVHPAKNRIALVAACLMQLIGLLGEALLLFSIPVEHARLRGSITRFIWFDAGGLALLALALMVVWSGKVGWRDESQDTKQV